jgi:hypothetical protein
MDARVSAAPRRGRLRRLALALALACAAAGAVAPAAAQTRRGAEIRLPAAGAIAQEGPLVRLVGVLDEEELRELLGHGFPIRIHFRTELWTVGGWVNDLRGSAEWDVVVRQNALARTFEVARIVGPQVTPLGRFATVEEAIGAAERPYRVPLVPPRGKRSYFNVVLDVETLSLSDLDEVELWLRGELRPAVRRPGTAGTAIGRGLKTLASRMLGGETRHYEVRSATFRP